MNDRQLLFIAQEAAENAYAPYSDFPVGAALECSDGTVYTGCNIENTSYGACMCAERVAVGKAVSDGKMDFLRIAIYGSGDNYCLPCGICRQVLWEFSHNIEILSSKSGGSYVSYSIEELLPRAFTL